MDAVINYDVPEENEHYTHRIGRTGRARKQGASYLFYNATAYQALLAVSMFCPLAATLLVKKVFLHQPTGIGWKVQGKRRYWLAAWFGPAVFTVLTP